MKTEKGSEMLVIEAKPEPIEIDLQRAAIIVVDMQNAFISKGGMFDVSGIDVSAFQKFIEPCSRVIDAGRSRGCKVIYIKMAYNPDLSGIGSPSSPNWYKTLSVRFIREHPELKEKGLIDGTWGSEVVAQLKPQDGDIILNKLRYSAFVGTNLDIILKTYSIKYLAFVGGACNVCLGTTLTDALFCDYFPILVSDATFHAGPDYCREAALYTVENFFGWVTDSEEFVKALGK